MSLSFFILALLTAAAAMGAMSLRPLVHCVLALVVSLSGLACLYLQLGAQFAGFAQLLVYIGAVGILIVFAVLLTRGDAMPPRRSLVQGRVFGLGVAVSVLGVLVWAISRSCLMSPALPPAPVATVEQIGDALMTLFVLPLELVGLLLTAALMGSVMIAMQEGEDK